jgi:hypothetical protein
MHDNDDDNYNDDNMFAPLDHLTIPAGVDSLLNGFENEQERL